LRPLAIVNPEAGGGKTRRKWPEIRDYLYQRGFEAQFRFTTGPGEGIALARRAVETGFDLVFAVGGDGTANEVANGLMTAIGPVRMAVVPTGTGHDLARSLGLRNAHEAIDAVALGGERALDLGIARWSEGGKQRSRYFLLECSTGFVTDVNRMVNRKWKRFGHLVSYAGGTLNRMRHEMAREFSWELDGVGASGRSLALVAFNCEYFGGGMHAAPGAAYDDGLLDVIRVGDVSRSEAIAILARIYRGKHLDRPKVHRQAVKTARIFAEGAWFDLDGEVIAPTPVEISVIPRAITLAQ
jgi:diacylglycerol kinase (ATP)